MKLIGIIILLWFWGGFCVVIGMYVNSLLSANHIVEREITMSEKSRKFWLCVFFMALGLIIGISLGGCKPKKQARIAACIACGDNGKNEGWFAYQMITGEILEQEGIGMDWAARKSCYLQSNGLGGIEVVEIEDGIQEVCASGITGAGGRMIAKGKRLNWTIHQGRVLYSQGVVSSDFCEGAFFDYATNTNPSREQAIAQVGCSKLEKYIAKNNKYSTYETNALLENHNATHTEIIAVLVQQQGNNGVGFQMDMNSGFMAVNLSEPIQYLKYASPFTFDFVIKTTDPEDIIGLSLPAIISTNAYPQGICSDVSIIASSDNCKTHIARSDKFLPVDASLDISSANTIPVYDRWTAFENPNIWDPNQYYIQLKQDWLSLIDPNLLDPNVVPDPNVLIDPADPNFFDFTSRLDTTTEIFEDILIPARIVPIKVIPINKEDFIYIEIDWRDPRVINLITDYWMTNKKLYDFNGDGIVNFRDWQ